MVLSRGWYATSWRPCRYPVPQPAEIEPLWLLEPLLFRPTPINRRALAQYRIGDQDVRTRCCGRHTVAVRRLCAFAPRCKSLRGDPELFRHRAGAAGARGRARESGLIDDYRDQIEDTLAGQREDREMDNWMREARRQTPIVYTTRRCNETPIPVDSAIAAAALLLAAVAGVLVLRSEWFSRQGARLAVSSIETLPAGAPKWARSDSTCHLRVEADSFVLHGTEPAGKPRCFARSIAVGVKIISL